MKRQNTHEITKRDKMLQKAYFDLDTNTVSYLVWDKDSLEAAIIDPVFDFDIVTGEIKADSADEILKDANEFGVKIKYVLETHAHADHLSGAPYVKEKTDAKIAIGENITKVQQIFRPIFNQDAKASDFDVLLGEDEPLMLGDMKIDVIYTPGHTPACVSFKIEDSIWVGDTLFMPDFGTARCDFPGGDAEALYDSISEILAHPDETVLYMCHDYLSKGRTEFMWETSVGEQKRDNIHIKEGTTKEEFVEMRNTRDAQLKHPKLLLPSIQTNINAGKLPEAEDNGVSYIKIPIKMEA